MNKSLLFIFCCFPARLLLAYIAKIIDVYYLPFFALITFIIGILFIKNFITNKPKTGFFGSKVWWSNYRLIHGINFVLFSITAFLKYKNAWIFLLCDAFIGLTFFIYEKYVIPYNSRNIENNVRKK